MTPAALRATEYRLGNLDQRVPEFKGRLTALTGRTPAQTAALDLLRAWDGTTYGPAAGTEEGEYTDETVTDGPAKTLWLRYMDELRDVVLADVPEAVRLESDVVASHVYDASPADNLVLRVLDPSASALRPSQDYLRGRSAADAQLEALDRAVAAVVATYGEDPAAWRAPHERRPVEGLTGVIGPSLTMPYMDRGSWVHVVAFAGTPVAVPPPFDAPGPGLPATGLPLLTGLGGLVLLAALGLSRRSGPRRRRP